MSILSWFRDLFRWSKDLKANRFTVVDPSFPQLVYDVSLDEMKVMLEHEDTPEWWKKKYQQILDENQ